MLNVQKKRTFKSGFRIDEINTLNYQYQFFHRFIYKYPQAIDELRAMLPDFQRVFGSAIELDVAEHSSLFALRQFDSKFLIQSENLLLRCHESFEYSNDVFFHHEPISPDFIRLPNNHEYKGNEPYYKRKFESSLIWDIAELKKTIGDSTLIDKLNQIKELEKTKTEEYIELAKKCAKENSISVSESDISTLAYRFANKFFDENNPYAYEIIDSTLKDFWLFYETFHNWISKYYLHRNWLRRSFFMALCRGLTAFWADVGTPINIPNNLKTELYGDDKKEFIHLLNELPKPELFRFKIDRYIKENNTSTTSEEEWQAEAFWLGYTRPQYEEIVLSKLEIAVNNVPFFDGETDLVEKFYNLTKNFLSDSTDDEESKKMELKNHLRQFPVFQRVSKNRREVIDSFQKHINLYLDELLPKISKHLRTKAGAPPKFNRIEWLLEWNIENLTAKRLLEKHNLEGDESLKGDESTIRKAIKIFKHHNLPVKDHSSNKIDWNDEWYLERIESNSSNGKKLGKKSVKKI